MRNKKLVAFISGSPIIVGVDIAIEAHKCFFICAPESTYVTLMVKYGC